MKNKDVYGKLTLFFAAACFLLLAVLVFLNFKSMGTSYNQVKSNEDLTPKLIYNDVLQSFRIFESFAPGWNANYAKLTRNHTRDTIDHPKYTVSEFGRKHQDIIRDIDNLKKQLNNWDPLPVGYIVKTYDLDYDTKHLVSTYRYRDEFFNLTQDLEQAFTNIIHHQKSTDTVITNLYQDEHQYTTYFRTLQRLDQLFFELVVTRYPKDLKFVTNVSSEFIDFAKNSAFGRQLQELEIQHDREKNTDEYSLPSQAKLCDIPSGELTTYLIKDNRGKILFLIKTETDFTTVSPEEKNAALKEISQCADQFSSTLEGGNYYYILTADGSYFSKSRAQGFSLFDDTAREQLMEFYADRYGDYYILGGYDAFEVFYPKQTELVDVEPAVK